MGIHTPPFAGAGYRKDDERDEPPEGHIGHGLRCPPGPMCLPTIRHWRTGVSFVSAGGVPEEVGREEGGRGAGAQCEDVQHDQGLRCGLLIGGGFPPICIDESIGGRITGMGIRAFLVQCGRKMFDTLSSFPVLARQLTGRIRLTVVERTSWGRQTVTGGNPAALKHRGKHLPLPRLYCCAEGVQKDQPRRRIGKMTCGAYLCCALR